MSGAAMPAETRALIGDLAERLLDAGHAVLALLDAIDGEADCEDDDPSGVADEDGINTRLPGLRAHLGDIPGSDMLCETEAPRQPVEPWQ